MPWFVIQRGIELLLGFALYDAFCECDGLHSVVATLRAMNSLEQIGALTAGVVLVTSLGSLVFRTWTSLHRAADGWRKQHHETPSSGFGTEDGSA